MTRRHLLDGFVTTLIATLGLTACDQSKPTSPTAASPNAALRFAKAPSEPSQVHGVNFLIKPQLDNFFCVQVESGGTEGRPITLQTCGNADTQRWALSNNSDGTNLILDSQAFCVDGDFHKGDEGIARTVRTCGFESTSRFVFTSAGLIRDVKNNMCLWVPGAASNANVSLKDCDETEINQRWSVAH